MQRERSTVQTHCGADSRYSAGGQTDVLPCLQTIRCRRATAEMPRATPTLTGWAVEQAVCLKGTRTPDLLFHRQVKQGPLPSA